MTEVSGKHQVSVCRQTGQGGGHVCVYETSGVCTDPVVDGHDGSQGSDRFSDLDSIIPVPL